MNGGIWRMNPEVITQLSRLNGLFSVRKPLGITSAKVVDRVKAALLRDLKDDRILAGTKTQTGQTGGNCGAPRDESIGRSRRRIRLPKLGHGGTLDMNATGVLVIGCGRGTKLLSSYLQGGKVYKAKGRFGRSTDTMDGTGKEVETAPYDHVTASDLELCLREFVGDILQVPPVYSALKVDGERMSDIAARGEDIQPKPARHVKVFHLQCLQFDPPDFEIEVHCGGGFYVRKLIHDVGKRLGTCAFMADLCRTEQGCFKLDQHALPEDKWTLLDILAALDQFHGMETGVR